jgi:hypothetical protein
MSDEHRPPQPRGPADELAERRKAPVKAQQGHYELHWHPTLADLVVIWWHPAAGIPSATNMTLGVERVPLMAKAMATWMRREGQDSQGGGQDGASR